MAGKHLMPWQRCPCCGGVKRATDDLCTGCWKSAPAQARRAHRHTLALFEKGRVFVDRVRASREALAAASREAKYGLSLFALVFLISSCGEGPSTPCVRRSPGCGADSSKAKDATPSKPDSAMKALPRDTGGRAALRRK